MSIRLFRQKLSESTSIFNRFTIIICIFSIFISTFLSCKKNSENDLTTTVNNGWQESMKGKILTTRSINYQSGMIYVFNSSSNYIVTAKEHKIHGASWSPDGSQIVFSWDSKEKLCIINSDGSSEKIVFEQDEPTAFGTGKPVWSNDVNQIAFIHDGISIINPNGTIQKSYLDVFIFSSIYYDWSPDKTTIAYGSCYGGCDVRILNLKDESVYQLYDYTDRISRPVWSKDGASIAFVRSTEANKHQIVKADSIGGKLEQIGDLSQLDIGGVNDISWSPDGKMIALSCGKDGIVIINIDGTIVTHLVDGMHTISVDWH